MQTIILGTCLAWCPVPVLEKESKDSDSDAVFRELSAGLPMVGDRARSARFELEHWHKQSLLRLWERKPVRTVDGKAAEVVLLTAPATSFPGIDFSMAFLLVNRRVIDWASCWTYTRTASQELLLEDVDGDGIADLAFRVSDGDWGLGDKRQHSRPGDNRKWLYAYAITSLGFQSLFPSTERDLEVKLSYDTGGQTITLQAKGLQKSLRERQVVECIVSVTNTSMKELPIVPGKWFAVKIDNVSGYFTTYGPYDKRTVLRPGESASQVIRLCVHGGEKEVSIGWKFVPACR